MNSPTRVTPRLIRILFKTETFASAVVGQRDIIVGMLEHTLRAVKSDRRRLTFAKLPENRPQKSTLPHLLLLLSRLQEVSGNDPAVKNFFRQDNGRIVMLLVGVDFSGRDACNLAASPPDSVNTIVLPSPYFYFLGGHFPGWNDGGRP